jgi:hypothetical protein
VQKETKRGRSKIRSWLRLFDGWTSIAGTLGDVAYKYRRGILQLYLGVFKAQVEDVCDDHRSAIIATFAGSLLLRFHGRIRTGSRSDASVNVHGERRRR